MAKISCACCNLKPASATRRGRPGDGIACSQSLHPLEWQRFPQLQTGQEKGEIWWEGSSVPFDFPNVCRFIPLPASHFPGLGLKGSTIPGGHWTLTADIDVPWPPRSAELGVGGSPPNINGKKNN